MGGHWVDRRKRAREAKVAFKAIVSRGKACVGMCRYVVSKVSVASVAMACIQVL